MWYGLRPIDAEIVKYDFYELSVSLAGGGNRGDSTCIINNLAGDRLLPGRL